MIRAAMLEATSKAGEPSGAELELSSAAEIADLLHPGQVLLPLAITGLDASRRRTLRPQGRLVLYDNARAEHLRAGQRAGRLAGAAREQAPALTEMDRVHHEPVQVDDFKRGSATATKTQSHSSGTPQPTKSSRKCTEDEKPFHKSNQRRSTRSIRAGPVVIKGIHRDPPRVRHPIHGRRCAGATRC